MKRNKNPYMATFSLVASVSFLCSPYSPILCKSLYFYSFFPFFLLSLGHTLIKLCFYLFPVTALVKVTIDLYIA